ELQAAAPSTMPAARPVAARRLGRVGVVDGTGISSGWVVGSAASGSPADEGERMRTGRRPQAVAAEGPTVGSPAASAARGGAVVGASDAGRRRCGPTKNRNATGMR